jgi:hypothetical protein
MTNCKPTAYKETWVIWPHGTLSAPITVSGVPNQNGDLPIIDGSGAITPTNLNFASEQRGVIKIGSANIPADTMPQHIIIENLEIRSAHPLRRRWRRRDDLPQRHALLLQQHRRFDARGKHDFVSPFDERGNVRCHK